MLFWFRLKQFHLELIRIEEVKILSRISDFLSTMDQFSKMHGRLFDRIASTFSLSRTEVELILFLSAHPDQDLARDIAQLRMLPKSCVSRAVDSLSRKNYLDCVPDKTDRRSVHLALSPQAQEVVAACRQIQSEMLEALLEGISEEEYQLMLRLMQKMSCNAARFL